MTQHSGYHALVRAYLEFLEHRDAHPDLAAFYTRRYRAFATILGVDLAEAPPLDDDDPERPELHRALQRVARFHRSISSPFSDYLEAP